MNINRNYNEGYRNLKVALLLGYIDYIGQFTKRISLWKMAIFNNIPFIYLFKFLVLLFKQKSI